MDSKDCILLRITDPWLWGAICLFQSIHISLLTGHPKECYTWEQDMFFWRAEDDNSWQWQNQWECATHFLMMLEALSSLPQVSFSPFLPLFNSFLGAHSIFVDGCCCSSCYCGNCNLGIWNFYYGWGISNENTLPIFFMSMCVYLFYSILKTTIQTSFVEIFAQTKLAYYIGSVILWVVSNEWWAMSGNLWAVKKA